MLEKNWLVVYHLYATKLTRKMWYSDQITQFDHIFFMWISQILSPPLPFYVNSEKYFWLLC